MQRRAHPDKEIEAVIRDAESKGWRVQLGGTHAWGRLYCPYNDAECRCGEFCITSIWSSPKNPGNFARKLQRLVDNCMHQQQLNRSK